ncbi:hypothetical protein L0337_18880 [candidate division KSB1 bacterium]|nr:hypothetical protein [candidate division KSB1 bacterium]
MNREAIIANVKKKYADADEATIDAVLRTLQETKFDWRLPDQPSEAETMAHQAARSSAPKRQFVGEHLSLEEYRKLSLEERGELKRRLKEQNRQWLEEKFSSLHAAWLMVLDGEIIATGDSMLDYPRVEKIREIGSRYGKRPFIFVNDLFIAIEENHVSWHPTVYRHDFYPVVPMTLRANSNSIEVAADFDTGAAASFADYDLLLSHAIIEPSDDGEGERAEHLGRVFKFVSMPVLIEIKLSSGEIVSRELPISCVPDWKASPFTRINPHRTALAGRDLFLELQPSILLDFANCRTKLVAPEQA